MPRPEGGYRLRDGTPVPGITTPAGFIKDAGSLIHWAWKAGFAGQDYRKLRDDAGTAGHLAHAAVEAWIRKQPYTWDGPPAIVDRAKRSFGAFREWAENSRLEVTHPEISIVSETYRAGGTLDAILISGKRAIGDWKTADGLYPEALLQLAAYGRLWDEKFPQEKISGGYHLIRFDKTFGDYHHHYWPELEDAWQAWVHCRALYDLRAKLKQRCR
jgi:hypothetical protein